jgi:N-acetylglucosaminyl-diphospho-decaprenol L-rhamnosyltransferase
VTEGGPLAVVAVVVNWNAGAHLAACVRTLVEARAAEVVVVDNGSADDSLARLDAAALEGVRVVRAGRNLGYGAGINLGASSAGPGHILVCNPDLLLEEGCIAALVGRLDGEPRLGIVAPRLRNPDGTTYVSGRPFPSLVDALGHAFAGLLWRSNPWTRRYLQTGWDREEAADVDWASGALLLVRRETFEQLGGFDERFFMFMEDVDLCWRAREAGWRVMIEPAAAAVHVVGASRAARPYRMIAAHHRSLWRWSSLRWKGWHRLGLPLVAVALIVRAALVSLAHLTGRGPRHGDRSTKASTGLTPPP